MSKLLQGILEDSEMQYIVLNYLNTKIEVFHFYREKNYDSYCNGINCLGGMGLFSSDENLDFHIFDNMTFIIKENGIIQRKIKYEVIEEYKIQYKEKNEKNKKILSVKIKSNVFNTNDYYLITPKESIFFDNLDKAKEYLNDKYNNFRYGEIYNG